MAAHDAFISYSYEADGELAAAVQRGLERMARPWHRVRALRVFRDRTGLSVNPELWSSITGSLDTSEWLVLLCSPSAARSRWVGEELRYWFAVHSKDRVLLVLTAGEIEWDTTHGDFDQGRTTAIPAALFGRYGAEPRYLDLRWAHERKDLDLRNVEFRAAIAELAAPIHGLDREELHHEDLRLARRARRLARGGVSLLVLLLILSIALAGLAMQQRSQAQTNAKQAGLQANAARRAADQARHALMIATAERLAVQSADALRIGRTDLGLLLAIQAEQLASGPTTRTALLNAVVDQPPLQVELFGLRDASTGVFSGDGHLLAAISASGQLRIWDVRSGQPLRHQPAGLAAADVVGVAGFADNGRTLVVQTLRNDVSAVALVDVATGQTVRKVPLSNDAFVETTATAAPELIASDGGNGVELIDTTTGQVIRQFPSPTSAVWALSPDGSVAASFSPGSQAVVHTYSTRTGAPYGPSCTHSFADVNLATALVSEITASVSADGRTLRAEQPDGMNNDGLDVLNCDMTHGLSVAETFTANKPGQHVVGVTPDGQYEVTRAMDADSTLYLNDPTTGQQVGPPLHAPSESQYMQGFGTIGFSPDGRLMTAPESDGIVRVWNLQTALPTIATRAASGLRSLADFGNEGTIASNLLATFADLRAAAVSDDGRFVAVMTSTQLVEYDVRHATSRTLPLRQLRCAQTYNQDAQGRIDPNEIWSNFRGLAVASHPSAIVIGCASIHPANDKGEALIYVDTSKPRWTVAPPVDTRVYTDLLLFSRNGASLIAQSEASSDQGRIQLLHVSDGNLAGGPLLEHNTGTPLLSPDNTGVIVRHQGRISEWTLANGQLSDLNLPNTGDPIGISEDSTILVTTDSSNTPTAVMQWDLHSKDLLGALPTGTDRIVSAAFGPNDRTLVLIALPPADGSAAQPVARTTWDLEPADWIRDACTVANRNLTHDEWASYLPGIPTQTTCLGLP